MYFRKGKKMENRWLLPFTHGVDMCAVDYMVRLAESHGVTLVPVSLVSVSHEPHSQGARLEHIQQSKDFLEAVKFKAARQQVLVERYEVFTSDVIQSITALVRDLYCDSILLAIIETKESLLHAHELKRLLMYPPAPLVIIRLPAHQQRIGAPHLGDRFLSLLRRFWMRHDSVSPEQIAPGVEESSTVGAGE
jgi:hypothetical protein